MLVKELMNKNLVSCDPDETISKAFSKMKTYNIHQLPVVRNGELYGLLELKNIITKDVNVSETKVSSLAVNTPFIDMETPVEAAADRLIRSGLRAIPVTSSGKVVGIISETDLMKVAKTFIKGLNIMVHEIITPAEYVKRGENVGKARRIMLDKNVSRVPVMDNGKVIGILGTLDFIRLMEGKERMQGRGGLLKEPGTKEKITLQETHVDAIMRRPVIITGEKTIANVIDLLQKNEEVVVEHEGKTGVITPKDIMELFTVAPKKQVYVQITGMHDESIEFKVRMDQAVNEFVQKMGKQGNIQYLYFHVERMQKGSKHDKYSVRARFKLPFGFFVAHAWGYNPINVIQDCMRKLEKEVEAKHGKVVYASKTRQHRMKYR